MRRHLIVFVKAPRLGAAKTRLARDIGAVAAQSFYRAMTARLIRNLARDARWDTCVAVTPDNAQGWVGRGLDPWPLGIPRMGQGTGDLGMRMARALAAPPPGPVVLIGSDCPDVRASHIAKAFRLLGEADAVFGPAEDGGYWLVGLKRRPFPYGLFRGARLSTPHALEDTLAPLIGRARIRLMDRLSDIDTGADYARWRGWDQA